jgi:DNA-binding transcriptional regulator YbjK
LSVAVALPVNVINLLYSLYECLNIKKKKHILLQHSSENWARYLQNKSCFLVGSRTTSHGARFLTIAVAAVQGLFALLCTNRVTGMKLCAAVVVLQQQKVYTCHKINLFVLSMKN